MKWYVSEWRFHWRFWRPRRDVIGGPVYFGWVAYCVPLGGGYASRQTVEQVRNKRSAGLIE